jgi:hypothetical protein
MDAVPSMRTPGGKVARGCWGKSAADGGLSGSVAVHDVAVLLCCTVPARLVKRCGLSFRFSRPATACPVATCGCEERLGLARDGR